MTSWWNHGFEWDDSDRLSKFDKANSTADDFTVAYLPGSWKRYKRVQDSTTEYFLYDGDNVVASYASDGSRNALYLTPGLDDNLSMTRGGSTYYYMKDGLGSVRTIVDANEATQNTYDYRAFGINHGNSEGVTSPYRFTAREFETGGVLNLHYYRNRFYGPDLGQFTSRDAFLADVHRGWGYVGNIPTWYVDPYGYDVVDVLNWGWDKLKGAGRLGVTAAKAAGCVVTPMGAAILYTKFDSWHDDVTRNREYCAELAEKCWERLASADFCSDRGLDRRCCQAFGPGGECYGVTAGISQAVVSLINLIPMTTCNDYTLPGVGL